MPRFFPRLFAGGRDAGDDPLPGPIRGELLGADRLAERARMVGSGQRTTRARRGRRRAPLLERLNGTRRILAAAHARLTIAAAAGTDVGPAGEWLVDNYHVVQEHVREVHESLPPGYYRELPELARGPLAGYPRVYELAITLISHTEARIDLENVELVVAAFQHVAPLSVGELWAIPAMLRLGLLESVRRMALRTVQRLDQVEAADRWGARIHAASGASEPALGAVLAEFMVEGPELTGDFITRLLHHLRPVRASFPGLAALERWIAEEGLSAEEAAASASQRLAVTQIVMANGITSLRAIGRMDWPAFVERQSRIERVLRRDPSGFYARMTFATRDQYRHVVERIAKRTGLAEAVVAERALALASAAEDGGGADPRRRHVGYYLIDNGCPELERATGFRTTMKESARRWILRYPDVVLVGGIASGTAAALAAVLWLAGSEARMAWLTVLAFALIPASEIAVSVMNQLIAALMPPGKVPKLELRQPGGVPAEFRTAVVIPTLFGSVAGVQEALENLEAQFLANREAHLHFAVLSDFTDSATETTPGDAAILEAAVDGVRALNARYTVGGEGPFYLFHRPRRWNPQQGVWMGWERKRGKLGDFNRFVRAGARDAFSVVVGDVEPLRGVRYVITLDADTVLPPDAAPLLVGAIAHPLNRAVYDPARGRVVHGYGILQPRVGVSLPSAHRSRFAAIFSGHPGVDPYTTAVSDVYQDLYREGSFTGKGIYDVEAFERATHGRFPENTLLSHDLIEGSYARAGLATDINVYDDYPSRYLTYTRRKHRWIRGDWQLLGWLAGRVSGSGGPERNRLSVLSRWKIFDNLRRSTVEMAQLAFLVAGWTVLPGSPLRWTLLGIAAVATPWIISLLLAAVRPPLDKSWRAYYAAVGRDAVTSAKQAALALTFLPYEAWISADAIVRTLWRRSVTKRSLLEWQTASRAERTASGSAGSTWRAMWPAVALPAALLCVVAGLEMWRAQAAPGATPGGGAGPSLDVSRLWLLAGTLIPLLGLWAASPGIAQALNAPALRTQPLLTPARELEALRFALLHWRFFDRFVSAETNWLAPDNYQEDPAAVVAMRTSPTNIGLQLLATASAYDLGFITVEDMARRLELAFGSMDRMRRFHGHLYNWYDLRDLAVLEPAYISTVDSGNLAGHLIALRHACLGAGAEPVSDARIWRALAVALGLADQRLAVLTSAGIDSTPALRKTVAAVGAQVWIARAALAEARRATVSPAAVAAPLERAHDALASAGLAPEVAEPAMEWIAWSLRRIAEHAALLGDLGAGPTLGQGDIGAGPSATLNQLAAGSQVAADLLARLEALAERAYASALGMEFRFLYDDGRKLFSIGYDRGSHALDGSYYDLLASEARLASFVAIAKNDVPVDHWFRLGRGLTRAAGATALVSWSGSMFEYLMPGLVMRSFPLTLLDQTYDGAVRRQMAYAAARKVPWGVSESAYNLRDRHRTYQYRAFGVPDLGLKRGLGHDLVIAPYATALAAPVVPLPALANLGALERVGALGPYGFRDAIDYTRHEPGQRFAIVRTYMAHHIGMGLVALTNVLTANVWQRRFHADSLVRSAELLLYERIPRRLVLQDPPAAGADAARADPEPNPPAVRELETVDTPRPHVALLGYLPYTLMVSHCGSGYSSHEGLAVTRWRADATRDDSGQFCYVKDLTAGRAWSAAHQPVCAPADWYRALLATDRVTFQRVDGAVETRTEITVVPEDSAEVRRVTVTNNGDVTREVELTSYGEIVLAPPDADRAHPAFSNLFVETEWHAWCSAVTATRRPRSPEERPSWCIHLLSTGKERIGEVTCETDRARFLGRGRSVREPIALERDGALSGTTGAVLDPIFSLRARLLLRPGQSASVAFTTLVAPTRERAFQLADRYHEPHAAQRAFELAWTSAQVELRELGVTPGDAAVFQDLAGHLLYPGSALRASPDELRRNRGSQPLLWQLGISGDLPILLATIDSPDGLPTLRQLFTAHHYWARHGMKVDLVVLNARGATYLQELNDQILAALSATSGAAATDTPGGVHLRRGDLIGADALLMLNATAAVRVLCDGRSLGRIAEPANRVGAAEPEEQEAQTQPARPERHSAGLLEVWRQRVHALAVGTLAIAAGSRPLRGSRDAVGADPPSEPLATPQFENGYGGLAHTGEYEVLVRGDHVPPAPWANVVATPHGGFVVTERGAGFTWAENSFFFRLTPWSNDPVSDPAGEVLYLRDDETGELWSATPAPIRTEAPYRVRHGAGASTFAHEHGGIATHLTLTMAEDEPVKLSLLRVTNHGERARIVSVTAYVEWTLGVLRERTQHLIRTSFDPEQGAIHACNHFDPQFAGWTAFCGLSEPVTAHTADRREFLGRNGHAGDPAALRAGTLTGATGAGLDPCAALECVLELAPGETRELVAVLGAAPSETEARRVIARYREVEAAREAAARTVAAWDDRLSVLTVRTPEPSFDAMVNRWTLYQALACRMWARSALYQSSGAYGFRDQLQDVMAFVYAEPGIAREHILRAAARQFLEGDVQHWWHPQSGRGIRTRFSDDLVWLPYVAEHYVRVTGDASVLDERVRFLQMRVLAPDEHEVYDLPLVADEDATLYEHCLRALRRACTAGAHGLPLMGTGDWNDGMNRVGAEGRGESVWLGWFLVATLRGFAGLADARREEAVARELRDRADAYAEAVEAHGWDGEWYRRAYFDDGTPLGSATNQECRIDSIAQSWSVISGAGDAARRAQAMDSLARHLVRDDVRLLPLLTPPFDSGPRDPGYIKGYLPGVRENGAQYTHAALWTVLATALRGDGDRAFELYQMVNPLTRARTPEEVETYRVEPYVVAADVYTAAGQLGRGGWTWYTGSASWMYRVGVEAILGFTKRGATLSVQPCVPEAWPEFSIEYRFGRSVYAIRVQSPGRLRREPAEVSLDGTPLDGPGIPLEDDGARHDVIVRPGGGVDRSAS